MESLGSRIRAARVERGLSMGELARLAHITTAYVSYLEHDRRVPGSAVLRSLSQALGVELPTPQEQPYAEPAPTSDDALVLVRQPDGSVILVQMDRRAFLATASLAAGATAIPLPDRLTSEVVKAMGDRLTWHMAAGRSSNPQTVARLVNADLPTVVDAAASAPKALRDRTYVLAARYAEYLGWMQQEAGDFDAAMRSTAYASDLAQVAGWRPMVAYATIRRSRLWQYRRPGYAAELASTVYARPGRLTPGLVAMGAAQAAEAYARDGQDTPSRRALDTASRALGRVRPGDEPPIGPDVLARDTELTVGLWIARCDLALGRAENAIGPIAKLVTTLEVNGQRTWALNGGQLAAAYARAGATDEAVHTAHRTLAASAQCASATGARELQALRPALQPWAGRTDIDEVLTALSA